MQSRGLNATQKWNTHMKMCILIVNKKPHSAVEYWYDIVKQNIAVLQCIAIFLVRREI